MDYIKQDSAFESWCENNYLPILGYVIWRKLFKRFNRSRWCEWVTVDNLTLMAESQIESKTTFIRNRDLLIEAGLIQYQKGGKGNPNKYKMKQLYEEEKILSPLNEPQTIPHSDSIRTTNDTPNDTQSAKEKVIQKENIYNKTQNIYIAEVIDYLNLRANKRFTKDVKTNNALISGRLNDGRTVDDLKYVIDVKCEEWLNTDMEKYLSPDTLFRPSHFDKYLNQKLKNPVKTDEKPKFKEVM